MADFGVLNAMRQLLADDEGVQEKGYADHIHLAVPPQVKFPMIVLELEEVWTSMKLGSETANTRLKLRASIMSKTPTGRESLRIAEQIREMMDGKILPLLEGKKGIVRLSSSVIDIPNMDRPRTVQQYYEVLIRG